MPSALCRCSIAILPAPVHRRGRPPPMVATPAAPISPPPRPAALPTSPSTRSAASPLPRWSRALGSTVVCATSAPASRRRSPASSARTAPPVAPGADWTTSRPTSGPPWWRTIWCCSPGSNRLSRARLQADEKQADQVALNCSFADSCPGYRYQCAKCAHRPSRSCRSAPCYPLKKTPLGAVGTSRACATEKSFFFFSYYYYYWGVPPEACPSSLKVEKTMASFSLRDTDNHFKGNLCISDLPFVTKSVAKMCDVPCIQWLS